MNELDDLERVRLLRATVPWPAQARLADGRARLLAAADAQRHAPRRLRSAPRLGNPRRVGALAAAAAVAAGIAGYAISARTASPARHPIAGHPTAGRARVASAAAQAVLAAEVLRVAAAHVAVQGVTAEPGPGQWIYSKTVDYQPGQPPGSQVDENWTTFDGTSTAYYQGGQLIVHASPVTPPGPGGSPWAAWNADINPKSAYDVLASLPTDPQTLLAVIASQVATQNPGDIAGGNPLSDAAPKTEAQREFDYLVRILWNAAGGVGGPPAAEAAAYRAMATLPGISVQQGITDAAGNPAIGISDDGGYNQLLIDPVNYQVTGLRQLSTGIAPVPVPPSTALLRGLLADPHAPLPAQPPGTMPLTRLRELFAEASKAEQDRLLAQWVKQWTRQAAAHDSVPPEGTVLESLAYAQVTEVAGPGQK